MARLSAALSNTPDTTAIDLTRLLSRLEQILLTETPESRTARASSFERTKIATNLEYARSLLLHLEREALAINTLSRKQSLQRELLEKRELIKRLNERLHELNQLDDVESNEEEEEDLLGEDTPSESNHNTEDENTDKILDHLDSDAPALLGQRRPAEPPDYTENSEEHPERPPRHSHPSSSTLRARRRISDPAEGSSHSTSSQARPTMTSVSTTEALLSHNRTEQETLTTSLLSMATALKESSKHFSDTLGSEKAILNRAGEGLDKNTQGMEAAKLRMGMLRRMTEGKGWWGRIVMYCWIVGLMIVALLLVGFLPKLRF
ncbi:hypothetical protein GP486_002833 [Trichoglossum hirsutum]|uniref:Synaptobrevin n=1 Tax=Trichoglossum hirsutum TaxID=265104 RepID=A0A9P8LE08_9PEZI|nr:hypothetical protein GP486_002833 [Trichoglossum hirsutum]